MTDIDITGLSKAEVLAALFNATAPAGMGFLQAMHGPQVMDVVEAQRLIDERSEVSPELYFDYVYGRCLKINLSSDFLDPRGFDRDNGEGATQRVIDRLSETGDVNPPESQESHESAMQLNAHEAMEFANTPSTFEGNVFTLGGGDVGAVLERAVDEELRRHEA